MPEILPQLSLDLPRPEKRPRRGRPPGRKAVSHDKRERFPGRFPQHVTVRAVTGVRLRRSRVLAVLKRAILFGGRRDEFRIVHYGLLGNHAHFIAEAADHEALARGMQGFEVRLARGINRALGRKGKLFATRYHARSLRTPREVRNALRYVLLNQRHHTQGKLGKYWIDPYSTAAWFDGWRDPIRADEPWMKELLLQPCPTAAATRWMLTEGWRRWGPIGFDEVPGS